MTTQAFLQYSLLRLLRALVAFNPTLSVEDLVLALDETKKDVVKSIVSLSNG